MPKTGKLEKQGYLRGSFGEAPNREKARKWASYAAKRGNPLAAKLLKEMESGGR